MASAGSSLKRRTAARVSDMADSGTPWFVTWKKPTVSAAALTAPTTEARPDGVARPARSMTGMANWW